MISLGTTAAGARRAWGFLLTAVLLAGAFAIVTSRAEALPANLDQIRAAEAAPGLGTSCSGTGAQGPDGRPGAGPRSRSPGARVAA